MTPFALRSLVMGVYEEELAARRVTKPVRTLQLSDLSQFLNWAQQRGKPDIRGYSKKDLIAYHAFLTSLRSKRSGQPLVASTINTRFGTIRKMYALMFRLMLIPHNPAAGLSLRLADPVGYKRLPLSKAQMSQFLEHIDTTTPLGLRDRTLFELIYSSGLRISEAAGLKVGDIDFARRIMIVRGKFDRDRMVPVSEVAHDFLLKFLGERGGRPEAWVFPGYRGHLSSNVISSRFRLLAETAGLSMERISAHSIRHSTATHLLENGASIRHVQELLGHHSIESTVRYTHVMSDNLAKIYIRHHPREHELFEVVDEAYLAALARL